MRMSRLEEFWVRNHNNLLSVVIAILTQLVTRENKSFHSFYLTSRICQQCQVYLTIMLCHQIHYCGQVGNDLVQFCLLAATYCI